jgi:outer membrane protein FlgP
MENRMNVTNADQIPANIKKSKLLALVVISSLSVSACSVWPFGESEEVKRNKAIKEQVTAINEKLPVMAPMVLRVVGYGAINEKHRTLSMAQRRLMAMRASKLDAYRAMAERVYGTAIVGNTTVENLVVRDDRFKAYVDTVVYGAKVVTQDMLGDGTYETVLEMVIDQGFRNCLTNVNALRQNGKCAADVVHEMDVFTENNLRRQGVEGSDAGLYFIE